MGGGFLQTGNLSTRSLQDCLSGEEEASEISKKTSSVGSTIHED